MVCSPRNPMPISVYLGKNPTGEFMVYRNPLSFFVRLGNNQIREFTVCNPRNPKPVFCIHKKEIKSRNRNPMLISVYLGKKKSTRSFMVWSHSYLMPVSVYMYLKKKVNSIIYGLYREFIVNSHTVIKPILHLNNRTPKQQTNTKTVTDRQTKGKGHSCVHLLTQMTCKT